MKKKNKNILFQGFFSGRFFWDEQKNFKRKFFLSVKK